MKTDSCPRSYTILTLPPSSTSMKLSAMPTTFLTGGSGFVGATVLDRLLAKSHKVIAAVRSQSSGEKLLSVHPEWDKSSITFVEVSDFSKPGAFDLVFQKYPEIDYIVHVAAPVFDEGNTDFVEHFEKPTVQGNISLLQAANQYGKNVKAIAVTGSINAITTGDQNDIKSRVLDSTQWLPMGREEALQTKNAFIWYCVAKRLSEEAIWSFVKTEKPHFTVAVFNPPLLFAPMLQYVKSADKANFSTSLIYQIMNSAKSENGQVPNTMFPGWIDMRDVADLHIASLTNPDAANKRFIVGHPVKFDQLAEALRKVPELEGRIGKNNNEDIAEPKFDTSDAEKVFGIKWRALDQAMKDTAESFLRLEAKA